jgi:hypothetical protein
LLSAGDSISLVGKSRPSSRSAARLISAMPGRILASLFIGSSLVTPASADAAEPIHPRGATPANKCDRDDQRN